MPSCDSLALTSRHTYKKARRTVELICEMRVGRRRELLGRGIVYEVVVGFAEDGKG